MLVNKCQQGNSVLKYLRNIKWQYDEIVPDYQTEGTCVLFLSIKYHKIYPEYIHKRLREIGKFKLKVMLVLADVTEFQSVAMELFRTCMVMDFTLILVGSNEEAASYLESFHLMKGKSVSFLKPKEPKEHYLRLEDFLTSIKSVSKTDSVNLIKKHKTVKEIILAHQHQLMECPGIGKTKAINISEIFASNFKA